MSESIVMLEMRYQVFGDRPVGSLDSRGNVVYGIYECEGAGGSSPEEVLDKLMLPRDTPYVIRQAPNPTYDRRMRRERVARSINSDAALQRRRAWSPFDF